MLILQACLEETDHASLCLAGAHQKDVCLTALGLRILQSVDKKLVGWNDRNASPCEERAARNAYRNRRNSALRAFSLKRRDSTRMSKEE